MRRALGPGRLWKRTHESGERVWCVDFSDASGNRHRRSLGPDKRVAEQRRMELIRQRDMELDGPGLVEGMNTPLSEIRDEYLKDLVTRASERHVINVTATLDRVLTAIHAQRVRDVKPLDLIRYRASRLKKGLAVRTANLECDVLRSMLRWAERLGLVAANPLKNLPRLRETEATKRYRRRAMTEDEVGRFLAAAEADDRRNEGLARGWSRSKGARLRALGAPPLRVPQAPLFRFLLEAATRYGETVRLTWSDVDLGERIVTLRPETTKAGRTRVIPIREGLVRELAGLREIHQRVLNREIELRDLVFRTPDGAAWCAPTNNIMRVFDRLLARARIARTDEHGRKQDIHGLRHTAATRLARSGAPLSATQRILGHSNVALTAEIYLHLETDDLREAIERLPSTRHGAEDRRAKSAT